MSARLRAAAERVLLVLKRIESEHWDVASDHQTTDEAKGAMTQLRAALDAEPKEPPR